MKLPMALRDFFSLIMLPRGILRVMIVFSNQATSTVFWLLSWLVSLIWASRATVMSTLL